ncbi:MAG: putative protein YqjD [Candidatus Erwinia impunctatus]|nr:putative protein YqjD [Culicoides impunctatus]
MAQSSDPQYAQLNQDIRVLLEALDGVLSSSSDIADKETDALRLKAQETLDEVRERAGLTVQQEQCHLRQSMRSADDYVHEKPWQSIGIAAVAGVIAGLLLGRR